MSLRPRVLGVATVRRLNVRSSSLRMSLADEDTSRMYEKVSEMEPSFLSFPKVRGETMEAKENSTVLPLFPLGAVVYTPFSEHRLNIFEPRYLNMFDDAMAGERMIGMVRDQLGPDYDVATHFTPRYNPWDQRVCLLPNGDLVQALKENRASVVTDVIADFTQDGIVLGSGRTLQADVIVAATGLQLNQLGDVAFSIGGSSINFADTIMWLPPPNLNTHTLVKALWEHET